MNTKSKDKMLRNIGFAYIIYSGGEMALFLWVMSLTGILVLFGGLQAVFKAVFDISIIMLPYLFYMITGIICIVAFYKRKIPNLVCIFTILSFGLAVYRLVNYTYNLWDTHFGTIDYYTIMYSIEIIIALFGIISAIIYKKHSKMIKEDKV